MHCNKGHNNTTNKYYSEPSDHVTGHMTLGPHLPLPSWPSDRHGRVSCTSRPIGSQLLSSSPPHVHRLDGPWASAQSARRDIKTLLAGFSAI